MISLYHDDFGMATRHETERVLRERHRHHDPDEQRGPSRFSVIVVRMGAALRPARTAPVAVEPLSPVVADAVPTAQPAHVRRRRVSTSMVPAPSVVEYEHGSPVVGASGLTLERSTVVYGRHPRVEVTLSRSGVFTPVAGRPIELVLVAGGHDQHLRIHTHLDRWPPDGMVTMKRTVRGVRAGVYSAYLEVPATHTLPAMRLANVGTWDDAAQRNGLHQAVVVQPFAPRIRSRLHLPMAEVVRQPERGGSSRS